MTPSAPLDPLLLIEKIIRDLFSFISILLVLPDSISICHKKCFHFLYLTTFNRPNILNR